MSDEWSQVLHAPSAEGGNPQFLSRFPAKLGVDSSTMTLRNSYLRYESEITLLRPSQSLIVREFLKLEFILIADISFMERHLFTPGRPLSEHLDDIRIGNG